MGHLMTALGISTSAESCRSPNNWGIFHPTKKKISVGRRWYPQQQGGFIITFYTNAFTLRTALPAALCQPSPRPRRLKKINVPTPRWQELGPTCFLQLLVPEPSEPHGNPKPSKPSEPIKPRNSKTFETAATFRRNPEPPKPTKPRQLSKPGVRNLWNLEPVRTHRNLEPFSEPRNLSEPIETWNHLLLEPIKTGTPKFSSPKTSTLRFFGADLQAMKVDFQQIRVCTNIYEKISSIQNNSFGGRPRPKD